MNSYLEQQLDNRLNLFRLWNLPQKHDLCSIRAVVGGANGLGANYGDCIMFWCGIRQGGFGVL